MTSASLEEIYRDLSEVMATTFPDRDTSAPIGPETRVMADLGLASIELIVLGERLEGHYGRKLPFGLFLASLRNRNADDLQLGELAHFLLKHAS